MLKKYLLLAITLSLLLCGCSKDEGKQYPSEYPDSKSFGLDEILYPDNSGKQVLKSDVANINYSNAEKGYVMAYLNHTNDVKIKVKVSKGEQKYFYDLTSLEAVALPLQMGDGEYLLSILKQHQGNQYFIEKTQKIQVKLENEFLPFLYPNQLVNYRKGDIVTTQSMEVVKDDTNDLERIKDIYMYVVNYLSYDDDKAVEATQKYIIPDLKELFKVKKGICFDYASMMVAMLRIQHIPARLICGNTDIEYHAWVEVYLEGQGWVNPDIFVDEKTWTRMDPTFASSKFDYDGQYEAVYYY